MTKKRIGKGLLAAALLAIVAACTSPPCWSQAKTNGSDLSTSRSIEGTVLSANGSPVPGAVVLIKDAKTLQIRSYVAQEDGKYHFYGLSTGSNYQLRSQAQGLTSKVKTVSVFDSRRKVLLNLKLTKKLNS
jgi:hypothetical protein